MAIDEATKDAPFDLDLINHHKYVSDPRPWVLPEEVEKLAAHLKDSAEAKNNELWKYFSLRVAAESSSVTPGPQDKTDRLLSEVAALRRQITFMSAMSHRDVLRVPEVPAELALGMAKRDQERKHANVSQFLRRIQTEMPVKLWKFSNNANNEVKLWINPEGTTPGLLAHVTALASSLGVVFEIILSPPEAGDLKNT